MAQVTRLGLYGGARPVYADFTPAEAFVPPVVPAAIPVIRKVSQGVLTSIKQDSPWAQPNLHMTQQVRRWQERVTGFQIYPGSGSPDGSLSKKAGSLYRDFDNTVAGYDLYIKRLDEIGGDPKLGWVLVSGLE